MLFLARKHTIKYIPCVDKNEVSNKVATMMYECIHQKPRMVLGLTAGTTLTGAYLEFIKIVKANKVNFRDVYVFNVDEYIDIDKKYIKYSNFVHMYDILFRKINIKDENIFFPNHLNCLSYDKKINSMGGIDLIVIALGANGHIGLNEPKASTSLRTHIEQLSNETRNSLVEYFEEKINVPTQAVTMGLKTIMSAKKIILVATGDRKAAAISKLFSNKYDKEWPLTSLIYHHDVTVFTDLDAAKLINSN